MNAIGIAVMLLLAAHSDAQVRGAVRGAARPAQQSQLPMFQSPAQSYPASTALNAAQKFPAPRLTSNTPIVSNAPNGYAAVAPAPFLSNGPNGYAAVAPAPFLSNGPNGYAAPAQVVDPYVLCDSRWRVALRREVMNPDNWMCATRMAADGSMEDCVITGPTSTSVFKNTSACGWMMPTFCDNTVTDLMNSLLKPSSANVTAPPGYTLIEGSGYYKVHTTPLPWDAAKVVCENEVAGGHLALIGKTSEYQALLDMVNSAVPGQNYGASIGYSDVALEGTFVAVTGQPSCMLGKLIYFGGSANNFGGNENCLSLGYSGQPNLNDYVCANPLPFICQLPLPSRMVPC